jgi:CheY-like chemotaxis protein
MSQPSIDESSRPVLIVDDDQLIRMLMSDMIREAGCAPTVADSAQQAEGLLSQKPLMAFVDVNLPGQQGDQFCRRLRIDDAFWDMPIVMMTSADKSEVVRRCFLAGADDFAPKPLKKHQVLAKLQTVRSGLKATSIRKVPQRTVLIATEKSFFSTVVTKLLVNSGYQVHARRTVEEALQVLDAPLPIHCAVIDLDLGPGSGLFLQKFRETPAYKEVPVFAVATRAASRKPDPAWSAVALYDIDDELESFVKHINGTLMGSTSRADRRGKPRVPFYSVVEFRQEGEPDWLAGYGYDLSETGVFVRTLTPLQPKKPLEVSFRLIDGGSTLLAKGLVVWANVFGPRSVFSYPCGMGLSFSYFPVTEWSHLREYIQSRLRPPP